MNGKLILNGKEYGGMTKGSTTRYGYNTPVDGEGLDGDVYFEIGEDIDLGENKIINIYININGRWLPFLFN